MNILWRFPFTYAERSRIFKSDTFTTGKCQEHSGEGSCLVRALKKAGCGVYSAADTLKIKPTTDSTVVFCFFARQQYFKLAFLTVSSKVCSTFLPAVCWGPAWRGPPDWGHHFLVSHLKRCTECRHQSKLGQLDTELLFFVGDVC